MFTTYFANVKNLDPSLNLVSIARKTPPGFPGRTVLQLAPTSQMLWDVKNGGSEEDYTVKFKELLGNLNVHKVAQVLGEDAILVCYEGRDKFCHRHLVADWLKDAGYSIKEL